ncbi:MAG: hypothetical protein WCX75_05680, partial [Fibrobacteraceae bacterium]
RLLQQSLFKDAQYRQYWPLFTPALARFLTIGRLHRPQLHLNNTGKQACPCCTRFACYSLHQSNF